MGGNEILPWLAGVDDLRRGPDLGEIAAFAEAERVLPRLDQPYRVSKQPPQPAVARLRSPDRRVDSLSRAQRGAPFESAVTAAA